MYTSHMAKRMSDVEVDAFKEALATIARRGTEAELKAHINAFFPRLPEDMQNDILSGLFLTALEDEAAHLSTE